MDKMVSFLPLGEKLFTSLCCFGVPWQVSFFLDPGVLVILLSQSEAKLYLESGVSLSEAHFGKKTLFFYITEKLRVVRNLILTWKKDISLSKFLVMTLPLFQLLNFITPSPNFPSNLLHEFSVSSTGFYFLILFKYWWTWMLHSLPSILTISYCKLSDKILHDLKLVLKD